MVSLDKRYLRFTIVSIVTAALLNYFLFLTDSYYGPRATIYLYIVYVVSETLRSILEKVE